MTAAALLADFRRAGVELFADAGRLRFRAPAGVLTASMREAVAAHREELLALVALPGGWDSPAASDALRECNNFLDAALTDSSLTPPQKSVAEVLRGVVRMHAEQGDPLLWSDKAFLAEQFAGWRKANGAAPTPSPGCRRSRRADGQQCHGRALAGLTVCVLHRRAGADAAVMPVAG